MSPQPTMTDELADLDQTFELVIPTGYDPHIVDEDDTLRVDAQLRIEADVREALGGEPSASQSSHGYGADGNAVAVSRAMRSPRRGTERLRCTPLYSKIHTRFFYSLVSQPRPLV